MPPSKAPSCHDLPPQLLPGRWPGEPSLLVPGLTEPEARALATRHGQNAFLHARSDAVPRLVLVR